MIYCVLFCMFKRCMIIIEDFPFLPREREIRSIPKKTGGVKLPSSCRTCQSITPKSNAHGNLSSSRVN